MPPTKQRAPRTLLEALIWSRRETIEEFSAAATRYAIENGLSATLSPRHVQRLAAGHRPDGHALGPVRAATRHLLESMLGYTIDELLSVPRMPAAWKISPGKAGYDLLTQLLAAQRIDGTVVDLFQQ